MNNLSVIVPVYNAENHLDKCIKSLTDQTFKNLEIILVNDGSTDKSGEICHMWAEKDSRIKVIHKENGGVSSARNAGLNIAEGNYIAFADSDDWLDINAYHTAMSYVTDQNIDLLVFGFETVFSNHTTRSYMDCNMFTRYEYKEYISQYISSGVGFNSTCHKIYRSDIIKNSGIRFNENLKINEDGIFNCAYFSKAHYIKCIPDVLYFYNRLSDNSTDIGRTDYLPQGKLFAQAMINAVQSKGLYSFASKAINNWYQKMLYIHLMFILLPNPDISDHQRVEALNALNNTSDGIILKNYLSELPGIKNVLFRFLYNMRFFKALIRCVKIQNNISKGK